MILKEVVVRGLGSEPRMIRLDQDSDRVGAPGSRGAPYNFFVKFNADIKNLENTNKEQSRINQLVFNNFFYKIQYLWSNLMTDQAFESYSYALHGCNILFGFDL